MKSKTITIFHSPDSDDAFMFYGMVKGAVQVPGYDFNHDLADIESLNHRALAGELDVTAVSVHAFAHLGGRYAILRYGASMGGIDYGPCIVTRSSSSLTGLVGAPKTLRVAIPGTLTSAALALRLYLAENNLSFELVNIHFDKVQQAIIDGTVDAGIIIHEGQLTHEREGLRKILDLGAWWWNQNKLPLPLGVNVVNKSLGIEGMNAVGQALHQSIEYSLAHRREALEYALTYGRGISMEEADKFVGMYVNERTRDIGEEGIRSIRLFLERGAALKLIPSSDVEFVAG